MAILLNDIIMSCASTHSSTHVAEPGSCIFSLEHTLLLAFATVIQWTHLKSSDVQYCRHCLVRSVFKYVYVCTIKTPEMQKPLHSIKRTGSQVSTVPEQYKFT